MGGGRASPGTTQGSKTPEMRNKSSTPTRRKARPSWSHPGAPALEGRSSYLGAPLSPGTRKNNGGAGRATETWWSRRIGQDTTTRFRSRGSWAQVSRACRPQHTLHDLAASQAKLGGPGPPPVLSLGTPAARPRSSIAPDPLPQPHQPTACVVSALPCFLDTWTFCSAKWVKGPRQKPSKRFLGFEVLHREHPDHSSRGRTGWSAGS